MSEPIQSRISGHSINRRHPRSWWLAGFCLIGFSGCVGETKEAEISASSSGFKPSDQPAPKVEPKSETKTSEPLVTEKASSTPSTSSTANSPAAASTPANPGPGATTAGPATPPSLPKSPALPSFDPTQIDPVIAAKSYMKLEMSSSQDPKELLRFLGTIDRAIQELQADATRGAVNNDLVLDRGMAISRIKLTASERLEKVASSPDETARALIGKLESLGQMAQFKDVPAADELRNVAKRLSTNEDAKVATQARRMQLMMAVTDLKNQAASADDVLAIATDMLDKMQTPDISVFTSVTQAAQALDMAGSTAESGAENAAFEACTKLIDLIEAKYRDVDNPQLGMMAWRLKMQRLPDFESYLKVLDTRTAMTANPDEVGPAARQLMDKVPSPWTAVALTQCATQFEYMGNVALAKDLLDIATQQLEKIKNDDIKAQIQLSIDGFKAKADVIGKPLPMDALVDTEGKPIDASRYAGKVVLVDFWATWCGPCLAEIPNIQKVYEKKHDAGFEVIAVNLDDQRTDLDAFMAQQKMPWTIYVSGVAGKQGMENPLARSLVINAIPFTMLIGKDGNVAAIHIRGAALESKVDELLGAAPKTE